MPVPFPTRSLVATIVVVTWSNRKGLARCLDALENQSVPRSTYRLLVVDNHSTDGSAHLLEEYRQVTSGPYDVVRLPSNAGFAGGVAAALQLVESPFTVLVNDDAVADHGMVEALLTPFAAAGSHRLAAVTGLVVLAAPLAPARSPVGVRAPGLLLDNCGEPFVAADDPRAVGAAEIRVNSTGNEVRLDGNAQDRDWLRPVPGPVTDVPAHLAERVTTDVFGLCGAAVALRTEAVNAVGGMDAGLFLYWEDTDLSWRLRQAGWTIGFAAAALAVHEHSASSEAGSPLTRYYNQRNRLIVLTRYAPAALVLRTLLRYVARTLLWSVSNRREACARWRVLGAYTRRLPADLNRRRRGESRAVVSRDKIAALLVPVPQPRGSAQTPSRRRRSTRARAAATTAPGPPERR